MISSNHCQTNFFVMYSLELLLLDYLFPLSSLQDPRVTYINFFLNNITTPSKEKSMEIYDMITKAKVL